MNKIKFSHHYEKLRGVNNASEIKLLQVLKVRLEDLSSSFLFYDTDGVYPLPKKGEYLMLIFEKGIGEIFTTLRRNTNQKEKYYFSKIGEVFTVEFI